MPRRNRTMATTNFTLRFDLDKERDAKAYQMMCEGADREDISRSNYIKNRLLTPNTFDVDAIATAVAIKVKDMMPMMTVVNPVKADGKISESEKILKQVKIDIISNEIISNKYNEYII